ncbi:LOW QUALITY PROTEIN: angiopoietin-related protein 2-like [Anableps anableps]
MWRQYTAVAILYFSRVIQRRQDGTVNFFMKWDHYKSGFGNSAGEYWLGLETMHLLTQDINYELRVDMEDFEGQKVFAHYSAFSVGPESERYKLNQGNFIKGAAGDSLSYHNGKKFTTTEDQEEHVSNCARLTYGGFWYGECFSSNPNDIYSCGPSPHAADVHWRTFKGIDYSLKTMIMKIRPADNLLRMHYRSPASQLTPPRPLCPPITALGRLCTTSLAQQPPRL